MSISKKSRFFSFGDSKKNSFSADNGNIYVVEDETSGNTPKSKSKKSIIRQLPHMFGFATNSSSSRKSDLKQSTLPDAGICNIENIKVFTSDNEKADDELEVTEENSLQKHMPSNDLVLHIQRIECSKLKNVEFVIGDRNDVYCEFCWCDKQCRTRVIDEAGSSAVFENLCLFMRPISIYNEVLDIKVMDKNFTRSNVLIGEVPVSLHPIKYTDERNSTNDVVPRTIEADIFDYRTSQITGHVCIHYIFCYESEVEQIKSLAISATPSRCKSVSHPTNNLVLKLNCVECFDLENVNKSTNNDVYCELKWSEAKFKTAIAVDAGSYALFRAEDMILYPKRILSEFVEIVVKDKNTFLLDSFIGEGKFSLPLKLSIKLPFSGEATSAGESQSESEKWQLHSPRDKSGIINFPILNKKGLKCGYVKISYTLETADTIYQSDRINLIKDTHLTYLQNMFTTLNTAEYERVKSKFGAEIAFEFSLSSQYELQNTLIFNFMALIFCIFILIGCIRIVLGILGIPFKPMLFTKGSGGSYYRGASQAVIICLLLSQTLHRLLAHVLGLIIRYSLRKSAKNNELFDIHIGWVSFRGFFDRNQLLIHNILWRNPPEFQDSPYLIHIKELSVAFDPWNVVKMKFSNGEILSVELGTIVIDGLTWYFEKAPTKDALYSLNLWAAMGASDKNSQKNVLHSIIMGIWAAIRKRLYKNLTFGMNRSVLVGDDEDFSNAKETSIKDDVDDVFCDDFDPRLESSIESNQIGLHVHLIDFKHLKHDSDTSELLNLTSKTNKPSGVYCVLQWCDSQYETAPQPIPTNESGLDLSFQENDMFLLPQALNSQILRLQVVQHGQDYGSSFLIGEAEISISPVVLPEERKMFLKSTGPSCRDVLVDLFDKDGERIGKVHIEFSFCSAKVMLEAAKSIDTPSNNRLCFLKSSKFSTSSCLTIPKPLMKKKTVLPTVAFDRLIVYDLTAYPLDLLGKSHSKSARSKSSSINIKLFHMTRRDVTGPPLVRGGPRRSLPADEFGDKFGDAFGLALMHNNTMAIMNLLAHAAVNKTKIGARDTIMGIIQTLPGLNSNVGNSDQQESDKEPVL